MNGDKVAVIGIGTTPFGELWERSLPDLFLEAGVKAIEDAGIPGEEVDEIYGGSMSTGLFIQQEHLGALVADRAGLTPIPSTRIEAACASGGAALRQGILSILAGESEIVVVGGVEKMTDTQNAAGILATASDAEWESAAGATFTALNALMARAHMHRYGTTRGQLSQVAVQNHRNALDNPHAHLHRAITPEEVLESPRVADPLHMLDCAPVSDGAAAVVLASAEAARRYTDTPVWVAASAQASDTLALHDRDPTRMAATVEAGKRAYAQAGLGPRDIRFAELHDAFTITEILSLEDLGFAPKGQGGRLVEDGLTERGGMLPVNPGGGLKGCGHPVGATGLRQVVEAARHLRGDAGRRQVPGETALTQNIGGSGATVVVTILRR
ncbi:MAG: thiolase domain-containing protein [Euryarchaeota archaeon]|nr:thiolase domain-containing protein [Euryarchaeota archaeon]